MPAHLELEFETRIGEDRSVVFTDATSPSDTTGWTLTFVATPLHDYDATAITKTSAASQITRNSGAGTITVAIAKADTSSKNPGTYRFQLRRTDAGFEKVLAEGIWTLRP